MCAGLVRAHSWVPLWVSMAAKVVCGDVSSFPKTSQINVEMKSSFESLKHKEGLLLVILLPED